MNDNLKIIVIKNKDEMTAACRGRNVWLYGAGQHSEMLYDMLEGCHFKIAGFLVSDKAANPEEKLERPICAAASYIENSSIVLWAIDSDMEMCKEVVPQNICTIYFVEKNVVTIYFLDKFKAFFHKGYSIEAGLAERGHAVVNYKMSEEEKITFRIRLDILKKGNIDHLKDMLDMMNPYHRFASLYGPFFYLETGNHMTVSNKTYAIYMARCHVDKTQNISRMPEWIIPIQVGAALTDIRLCDIADNTGDNISFKNRDYSECTAIYWMWKNAPKTDYIGLCHYRRHFALSDNDISAVEKSRCDIVLTIPELQLNNECFFEQFINKKDIEILKQIMKEYFPNYYETTGKYCISQFTPVCNMFIMKYDIFMDYATFVFGVAERIDSFYRSQSIVRNDRYLGYLMEMLLGIYVAYNSEKYKIGYVDMEFINVD